MFFKKLLKSNKITFSLYKKFKAIRKFFAGTSFFDLPPLFKFSLILKVKSYTLLSYKRLSFLYEAVLDLKCRAVDGDFVECGSWNGGSAAVISVADKDRRVWLFDSWEGMPEGGEYDTKFKNKKVIGEKGMAMSSFEKINYLLFNKLKINPKDVSLVKGWFEETIPNIKNEIGKISLLHLDCDWYESVKFCLENFYDKVVSGGYIIIDDYGSWAGCKKAVDEFKRERELNVEFIKIDKDAVYFIKP